MSTPKITIKDVYTTSVSVCVQFEFNTGEKGQLNFPLGTSDEEIERALKSLYDQKTAEATKNREALRGKTFSTW